MVDDSIAKKIRDDDIKLRAVILLQSAYRGYVARRAVQRRREEAAGQETAIIFFLQQVENSSELLYSSQKATRKSIHRRETAGGETDETIEGKLTRELKEYLQLLS